MEVPRLRPKWSIQPKQSRAEVGGGPWEARELLTTRAVGKSGQELSLPVTLQVTCAVRLREGARL